MPLEQWANSARDFSLRPLMTMQGHFTLQIRHASPQGPPEGPIAPPQPIRCNILHPCPRGPRTLATVMPAASAGPPLYKALHVQQGRWPWGRDALETRPPGRPAYAQPLSP